jgi:ribosome biogenesis GTPase
MPRRRLSERQIRRIRKVQERRRRRLDERAQLALTGFDEAPSREGLVVVRHGANLAVEDDLGHVHHCLVRQNIGHPVCGDLVVFQPTGPDRGVVTAIQDRHAVLSRPDYSGRDKPLAANLSQLVVVLAPSPEPSPYLIDQYLVAAELVGAKAVIVCNKVDLLEPSDLGAFEARFARYGDIGYPLIWISLRDGSGLGPLIRCLEGETSILVGQSGVGKSSLVNTLLPDQDIQIGRLSKASGLGRHTTSAATCYRLPGGGRLIDSPGVRSFRLGAIGSAELDRGFREIAPFIGHCRFANCRHDREPGCAVKRAAAGGRIHPERLTNFLHLSSKLAEATGRY